MPTDLTLNNIPDDVYDRLKQSAADHGRCVDREAIKILTTALLPGKVVLTERLFRARQLRASAPPSTFFASDIQAFKQRRRP